MTKHEGLMSGVTIVPKGWDFAGGPTDEMVRVLAPPPDPHAELRAQMEQQATARQDAERAQMQQRFVDEQARLREIERTRNMSAAHQPCDCTSYRADHILPAPR